MTLLPALVLAVAAALLASALTPLARWVALRVGAVDHPNARKVHSEPTPRLGGLAVVGAAALVLAVGATWLQSVAIPVQALGAVASGLVPIFLVSLWDDIRPLKALPKLAGQTLGASIAIGMGVVLGDTIHVFGTAVTIGPVGAVGISLIWLIGVTNAFNLVDGLDGLASGLALISCGTLTAVFVLTGSPEMAQVTLVLAGAIAGFLPFNLHPARIFLGDCGSAAIGFCLACLALKGGSTLSSGFAALIPVFALGLPVAETLVSIARRVARRIGGATSGVFEADRDHFHHRLLALGLDHRRAVLALYGVGIVASVLGLISILATARQAGMVLATALLAAVVGISRLGYDEFSLVRSGRLLRVYDYPVLRKAFFVVFADLVLVAAGVWLALALRLDSFHVGVVKGVALEMFVSVAPITIFVFWRMGIYKGAWRVAGVDDFSRLSIGVGVAHLVACVGNVLMGGEVPLALFAISGLVCHPLLVGARISYRVLLHWRSKGQRTGSRTLIYGAGTGGLLALRELQSNESLDLRPVGFLDDDPSKRGVWVNGYKVFGGVSEIEPLCGTDEDLVVIVSSRKITRERLEELQRECVRLEVRVLQLEVSLVDMATVADGGEGTVVPSAEARPVVVATRPGLTRG